jgi:hypothetical protein
VNDRKADRIDISDISSERLTEISREADELARIKKPRLGEWEIAIPTAVTAYSAIFIFAHLVHVRSTDWNEIAGIGTALALGVIAWVGQHSAWRQHYRSRNELFCQMILSEQTKTQMYGTD